MSLAWLAFAVCALLIGVAGPVLTRAADRIADLLALSRSWVGLILLSTATSLPELATGMSAVAGAGEPDIAIGDALGSTIFNLMLLAVLDALSREGPLFRRIDQRHILTATFGIMMIAFVGVLLLVARGPLDLRIGSTSAYAPLLLLLYALAVRALYQKERADRSGPSRKDRSRLARSFATYGAAAAVVTVAGAALPFAGEAIAQQMGWRTSFVGTILVAAATSLPECVVILAALRIGGADLAVATLLGSNLFDIALIAVDDFVYTPGSIIAAASPTHAATALVAVIMSAIVIIGILNRPSFRILNTFGWTGLALIGLYLATIYTQYLIG